MNEGAGKERVAMPLMLSAANLLARLRPWQARALLLVVAAMLSLLIRNVFEKPLTQLEEQVGGLGWLLAPETNDEERISIIQIDEKSLEEVGPWPWSREVMAQLSERLSSAGVQLQLYDITFPEEREGDEAFLAELQQGNAVIAQVPVLSSSMPEAATDSTIRTGVMTHAMNGLVCENFPQASNFVANNAVFSAVPKGHIATLVDSDGAVRRIPAAICVDGQMYPALSISALLTATGTSNWSGSVRDASGLTAPAQWLTLDNYPGLAIPVDDEGFLRVSFRNAPDTYRAFSATDVLNNRIDPELLEGTWALVGYTAFGLVDIVPTPYSGAAAGVELQARILASILDETVPYSPNAEGLFLSLIVLAFAGVLWLLASGHERVGSYALTLAALLFPALMFFAHALLLTNANLWLGWLTPSLFAVLGAALLVLNEYGRVRLERSRVLGNLSSYLPTDVAQEIAYSLPDSSINAQRKDVTLLCADLRNFSAYSESRPPEEPAALLHYFFVKATEIVEKFNGRVHEFKGDCVLAIWDGSDAVSARQALFAALELQETIVEVLPQHPPAGLEPLALGIGIEQGPVLIGSLGPAHRRSHTLLGESVTITMRIQEMTAELAHPILVGECAARQLSDQGLISQGSYLLNGLRNPHILYAPSLPQPEVLATSHTPPLRVLRGGRH